jgi:hypothetical protein
MAGHRDIHTPLNGNDSFLILTASNAFISCVILQSLVLLRFIVCLMLNPFFGLSVYLTAKAPDNHGDLALYSDVAFASTLTSQRTQ